MHLLAKRTVLLLNPNRMRPPIAPIGIEYLLPGLEEAGYGVDVCDLTFSEDWRATLHHALSISPYNAILDTVRNLDDAYFASQDFILDQTLAIIKEVRLYTSAPIILGGVGFSIAPCEVLRYTGADYGIAGDGEGALPTLLESLHQAGDALTIPGVVARDAEGNVRQNGWAMVAQLRDPNRQTLDHSRYFAEGGQCGLETKRGCPRSCTYCVEPVTKGRQVRLRQPEALVAECRDFLERGIHVFHTCDSEFNLPHAHAAAVCQAFIDADIGKHMRWYAYAYPMPFDTTLARLMARAGCVGINFGVDHTDPDQLRRLGRQDYTLDDLQTTVQACREADIKVMFDLLLGGPGETRSTLRGVIESVRALTVDCVGLSCGVRVYPHTPLATQVRRSGPLADNPHLHGCVEDNDDFLKPVFYVDAGLNGDIHDLTSELVGGDPRFLHANPNELAGNYNYNDNSTLSQAIRGGARGAYWDILQSEKKSKQL